MTGPLLMASLMVKGPLKEEKTVIIPHGTSVKEITDILDGNGILVHPLSFRAASRLIATDKLKAGEYRFTPGQSAIDVAIMMHEGRTVPRQFTAPEGLTSWEIVALLRAQPDLSGEIYTVPPEGSLLPETYRYSYGDNRESLIRHMQRKQKETLEKLWATRNEKLPIQKPIEAVILASIVEKETGLKPQERAIVAGVFYNRLRKDMPLQTDPTVIYALTKGEKPLGRALTRKDLGIDSLYNTYLHPGLPPSPICNPGEAALEAVLNPAQHDLLYFVADGTGGHAFAKTLEEHNKNVSDWIKLKKP